jgi:TPP-dependent 2-oxoacid decarboxylase
MLHIIQEILSYSERCGVAAIIGTPRQLSAALDEALFATNLEIVNLLFSHGAKLQNTSVLTMLKRIKNRKNADININNCLNAVLKHALEVGPSVLPVVPTAVSVTPRVTVTAPVTTPAAVQHVVPNATSAAVPVPVVATVSQVVTKEEEEDDEEKEEPVRKRRRRQ